MTFNVARTSKALYLFGGRFRNIYTLPTFLIKTIPDRGEQVVSVGQLGGTSIWAGNDNGFNFDMQKPSYHQVVLRELHEWPNRNNGMVLIIVMDWKKETFLI